MDFYLPVDEETFEEGDSFAENSTFKRVQDLNPFKGSQFLSEKERLAAKRQYLQEQLAINPQALAIHLDYLSEFIEGVSEEEKIDILHKIVRSGINPGDPLFLPLAAMQRVENLVQEAPRQFQAIIDVMSCDVMDVIEARVKASVEAKENLIKEMALRIFHQVDKQFFYSARGLTLAGGIALGILLVGILSGLAIPVWFEGGYQNTKITQSDWELLRWAKSEQGKKAREIYQLNQNYLPNCRKDAQNLSLSYGQGRENQNVCVLMIAPPDP